jgi:hypothetical protein
MQRIIIEAASRATKPIVVVLAALALVGGSYAAVLAAKPPPAVPPPPKLTATPPAVTNQTGAEFSFTDDQRGVSFRCRLDGSAFEACTSPKRYPGPLAQGQHGFEVRAVDANGNLSAVTSYGWTVDTTPPPPPAISSGPADPTTERSATFAFGDAEAGVGFRCQLDGGGFSGCSSPKTYSDLSAAAHTFAVQALDAAGNASAAASYGWTVLDKVSDLTLGGDLAAPLYPGASRPLNVLIGNPFSFDVHVSGLTVTVRRPTTRDGQPNPSCDGTANLRVLRQYGGPVPLRVPGNRTLSLADLGVPQSQWPQLLMPDLPVNQDACKRTTFTFDYAATATKVNR